MSARKAAIAQSAPGRAARGKLSVRLWLRLLSAHNIIEQQIRRRLHEQFGRTLPQFDVLAELEHAGEPQTMSQVSRRLLVSNGNLTGVVDRLVREGLVNRQLSSSDRRVQMVSLTETGRSHFHEMARAHESWMDELFSGLDRTSLAQAEQSVRRIRDAVREQINPEHGVS